MVSALYYERRRETAARAADRDLRDAAEAHRRIYRAIRARDASAARSAMDDHLKTARHYQARELHREAVVFRRVAPARLPRRQAMRRSRSSS
jgi:DNA-binding FadR family transcriptional regulator